jgi:hypothetical protein
MGLMIKWNEITWYSRLGAIILFLGVVPALSFYIGIQYESILSTQDHSKVVSPEVGAYPPTIAPLASSTNVHVSVSSEFILSGTTTAPGTLPSNGGVEVKIIPNKDESGTAIFGDAYFNGKEIAKAVPVESTLESISPGGTYYAYRSLSHASAGSSFVAVQIFNLNTDEHTEIKSPPGEKVSNYVLDSRAATWYNVMPYIESYAWQDNHSVNFIFYYFAWGTSERVSPRQIWNYNLNTKQFSLISEDK